MNIQSMNPNNYMRIKSLSQDIVLPKSVRGDNFNQEAHSGEITL